MGDFPNSVLPPKGTRKAWGATGQNQPRWVRRVSGLLPHLSAPRSTHSAMGLTLGVESFCLTPSSLFVSRVTVSHGLPRAAPLTTGLCCSCRMTRRGTNLRYVPRVVSSPTLILSLSLTTSVAHSLDCRHRHPRWCSPEPGAFILLHRRLSAPGFGRETRTRGGGAGSSHPNGVVPPGDPVIAGRGIQPEFWLQAGVQAQPHCRRPAASRRHPLP